MTREALKETGLDNKAVVKCKNMFALGICFYLFHRPEDHAKKYLDSKFARKNPLIAEANKRAIDAGYNFAANTHQFANTYAVPAAPLEKGTYRSINGNVATAWGLMAAAEKAGLPLFCGSYPITPATVILEELAKHKELGVKTVQAEDEIAGICTAIGAAFAGNFAVTTTSGPGLSLKSEALGLAVMAELPLVVVDVQRGGPSTGLPTKTEQSDLMQALYGRNGECPVVVLAASTPGDCFRFAFEAGKIAMEHMTPVILLTDGFIANGSQPWRIPQMSDYPAICPPVVEPHPEGEAFMQRYAPGHADLAARDVVSRAIRSETDAGRGVADPKDPQGRRDCVWLDMRGIDADHMNEVLPEVVATIRKYANLDPAVDLIPVKPTAHYTMGGIPVTVDGEVYRWTDGRRATVEGLFAAGECSCVSVHGANRLGGNSLLDACLFGTRAGRSMAARLEGAAAAPDAGDKTVQDRVDDAAAARRTQVADLLAAAKADADIDIDADGGDTADGNPYRLMAELGAVMESALAVHCSEDTIAAAREAIAGRIAPQAASLHPHSDTLAFNQELTAIWEVRHLIDLGSAMLEASDARHESRGSLYRMDFPARDDERFLAHSMTDAEGGIGWQPVHIEDMPPQARSY